VLKNAASTMPNIVGNAPMLATDAPRSARRWQGSTPFEERGSAERHAPCKPAIYLGCAVLPGIIDGINVLDLPRTHAVKLDDGTAVGPGEMFHASGPVPKRAGGHCLRGRLNKFAAHAEIEDAADEVQSF
jgi:hypothetical protein